MAPTVLSLAERLSWILENRRKTATGRKMSAFSLARAAGLSRTHVYNLIRDPQRHDMTARTAEAIAWAARISKNWLQTGRGSPDARDVPSAPPPREDKIEANTYGEYPDWTFMVSRAMELSRPIDPEEASVAGADLVVRAGHRPPRLTPELVRAVCEYAWLTSSDNKKGAYCDKFIRLSRQRDAAERAAAVPNRPKRILRESGFPPFERK